MAIVNITTYNDADFYRTFLWQTVAGVPIDMTGMALEMMLRRHTKDAAAVLRLATDTGEIVLTNPVAGEFRVWITQDTLVHLGLGDYDQSNIATWAGGGLKVRIWSGTLTVNAGATR